MAGIAVIVFGGDNNKCVAGPKGLAQYHHGWREVCLVDRWEIDLGNIDHFNVEMRGYSGLLHKPATDFVAISVLTSARDDDHQFQPTRHILSPQ